MEEGTASGASGASGGVRVTVFRNGVRGGGKALLVAQDTPWHAVLEAAAKKLRLNYTPTRVYAQDGTELHDTAQLHTNDVLFVAQNEDFLLPRSECNCRFA